MQESKQEAVKQERNKEYNDYVKQVTTTMSLPKNMLWAFIAGGIICAIGQIIGDMIKSYGIPEEDANSITILILIGASAILTGLNIYQKIGNKCGAGALVPITGFANSVAASAIEFKVEGQVFGIGCKIFTIAGPVILYGIFSSWLLGVIYWVMKIMGVA
jgi:stage V sporulation protein AC